LDKPWPRPFCQLFLATSMMTKTLAFALAGLPLKWAGLAIPDPTTLAHPNYEASILLCSHILAAFPRVDVFRSVDHLKVIREVKAELKLRSAVKNESSLNDLASKMSCNTCRTILRGKETGQWLPVLPSTLSTARNARLKSSVMLYFCGTPVAHRIYQSSAMAASRSLTFAMRLNASAAVS
jgi:hypothetical protein